MRKKRASIRTVDIPKIDFDFDFANASRIFPEQLGSKITVEQLVEQGFETVGDSAYVKNFGGVVKLKIAFDEKGRKLYNWSLDEVKLREAIGNLEKIKVALGHKSAQIAKSRKYRSWNHLLNSGSFKAAGKSIIKMKQDFSEKHAGFLSIHNVIPFQSLYWRRLLFCFDFCKTSHQLHLFFKFIELRLDVMGGCEKSTPRRRTIEPRRVKKAIRDYHYILSVFSRIRMLYQEGKSSGELKKGDRNKSVFSGHKELVNLG